MLASDASLQTALDQARDQFRSTNNVNFIFEDVDGLDAETPTSKEIAATVQLAEQTRQGCVILLTDKSVWSGLSMLGMLAELDLPLTEEILVEIAGLIEMHKSVIPIEWGPEQIRQAAETLTGVSMVQATNIIATMLAKGHIYLDDIHEISKYKDRIIGSLAGVERIRVDESAQVGGLKNLRKWLDSREELMSADLSGQRLKPPKGILLCGVPGCGKSLSAKAIAYRWKLPLYRLDMSGVLGKYIGQSEAQFRDALAAAERVAPCILWVDEIEKALSGQGDNTGVHRRIIGEFLYWLQESKAKVFMVATANDIGMLPPELLRKGRFDEIFFVDLPTEEERREILQIYFNRYLQFDIPPDLLDELAQTTEGFSGSDLDATVNDIAVSMFAAHTNIIPDDDRIKTFFMNVIPYSRTNPEEVNAIRNWGMQRAVAAGEPAKDLLQQSDIKHRQVVFL